MAKAPTGVAPSPSCFCVLMPVRPRAQRIRHEPQTAKPLRSTRRSMTTFCPGPWGERQSGMRASYNGGMSVADGMPPAILLPADPDFRESRDRDARSRHLRRGAIVAAALAHVLVITAMIVHWPNLFPVK